MNLPESPDDNDTWLCPRCSEMIESIFHCPVCKVQPPWGCDCADCQYPDDGGDDDDYDIENDEYFQTWKWVIFNETPINIHFSEDISSDE